MLWVILYIVTFFYFIVKVGKLLGHFFTKNSDFSPKICVFFTQIIFLNLQQLEL